LRQEDLQSGKVPTAPTISSLIGGLQAQEAVKLLHDLPVLAGEALIYNGLSNQFYRTRFQHREDCLSHETYADILELPLSASSTTASQLLSTACQAAGLTADTSRLVLDRDLVLSIDCIPCGTTRPIMKALTQVGIRQVYCPACGEIARPNITHEVEAGSELADRRLSELGVPAYDIVRVTAAEGECFVTLAADRDQPHAPCEENG